jgi:hypothetical protein
VANPDCAESVSSLDREPLDRDFGGSEKVTADIMLPEPQLFLAPCAVSNSRELT